MSTETDNVVLERLRIMRQESQTRFDQLAVKVDTLTAEIRVSNAHVAGLVQSDLLTSQRLTDLENRMQRLERALPSSGTNAVPTTGRKNAPSTPKRKSASERLRPTSETEGVACRGVQFPPEPTNAFRPRA